MKKIATSIDARLALRLSDMPRGVVSALKAEHTHSNPEFWKKKRMGFWLGGVQSKIKSWEVDGDWLILPRGNRPKIVIMLEERGFEMSPIWDRMIQLEPLNLALLKPLYPYQADASAALAMAGNGIVRGPCGSGKTIVGLAAIAQLSQPTLVIVHKRELMRQWQGVVSEWLGIVAGTIGGGKPDNIRPVTIGMQQTIWRRQDAEWISRFGTIFGDEIHRWGSRTFQIVANMFPARYKIGCSADERRKDGKEFLIYETFGECVSKIHKEHLIELGRLLPVEMEVVPTTYTDEDYCSAIEVGEPPNWGEMLDRLTEDPVRNELVMLAVKRALLQRGARVLILTERVDAVRAWGVRLKAAKIPHGLMIGGGLNREELERTVDGLRDGSVKVGIGTTVADEGLDIPALTHVMLTCPVHTNPKRLTQMVGRAARKWRGKKHGTAVYFWDREMFPAWRAEDTLSDRRMKEKSFLRRLGNVCGSLKIIDLKTEL